MASAVEENHEVSGQSARKASDDNDMRNLVYHYMVSTYIALNVVVGRAN
jgi:hypothetical protein